MKTVVLILILFPTVCFVQEDKSKTTAPKKPSTTDCPTWNKKSKKSDKAAYFEYLKSHKKGEYKQVDDNRFHKIEPKEVVQKTENTSPKKYLINPKTQPHSLINTSEKEFHSPKTNSKAAKIQIASTVKKEEKKN